MNKQELIELVQTFLGKVNHGIAFDVISEGVRQEDSWWYVPVLATRNGKDLPREMTVNIFANVEDELDREKNVSVLFVPVVPEQEKARSRGRKAS